MLLANLQNNLQSRYDLDLPYQIEHFFSSDRELADQLADDQERAGQERPVLDEEVVFIQQQDDTLEFTVYVDKDLLAAVNKGQSDLDGLCTVIEGVSHAVCLLWHAHNERQIRPIELELQAEIDKFMILIDQLASKSDSRDLHQQLFARSRLLSEKGTALYGRYRAASQLASSYCQWLHSRFIEENEAQSLASELARFYRLSGRSKIEYIRRLH